MEQELYEKLTSGATDFEFIGLSFQPSENLQKFLVLANEFELASAKEDAQLIK